MQPQISIVGLSIEGIRSFAPADESPEQRIGFHGPLTVILGPNGAGKSTIIECLRNATTGEVPGTGKSWLHSPSLAGHTVNARIRLVLTRTVAATSTHPGERAYYRIERSFRQSVSATGDGVFNRLPVAIYRKDATAGSDVPFVVVGQPKDLAASEAQVSELVGVPPDLLKHVLFCPQDESLWPLDPSRHVQRRLDAIFGCGRISAAVAALRELSKAHSARSEVASALATERERLAQRNALASTAAARRSELEAKAADAAAAEYDLAAAAAARAALDAATDFAREMAGDATKIKMLTSAVARTSAALPPPMSAIVRAGGSAADAATAAQLELDTIQRRLAAATAAAGGAPLDAAAMDAVTSAAARADAHVADAQRAHDNALRALARMCVRYSVAGHATVAADMADGRRVPTDVQRDCEAAVTALARREGDRADAAMAAVAAAERAACDAEATAAAAQRTARTLASDAARLAADASAAGANLAAAEDAAAAVAAVASRVVADAEVGGMATKKERTDRASDGAAAPTGGPAAKRTRGAAVGASGDSDSDEVTLRSRLSTLPVAPAAPTVALDGPPAVAASSASELLERLRVAQRARRERADAAAAVATRRCTALRARAADIAAALSLSAARLAQERAAASLAAAETRVRPFVAVALAAGDAAGGRVGRLPGPAEWHAKVAARVDALRRKQAVTAADVVRARGDARGAAAHVEALTRQLAAAVGETVATSVATAAAAALPTTDTPEGGPAAPGAHEAVCEAAAVAAYDAHPTVAECRAKSATAQRRLHAAAGKRALLERYTSFGADEAQCPLCERDMTTTEVDTFRTSVAARLDALRSQEERLAGATAADDKSAAGADGTLALATVDACRAVAQRLGAAVAAAHAKDGAVGTVLAVAAAADESIGALDAAAAAMGVTVDDAVGDLGTLRGLAEAAAAAPGAAEGALHAIVPITRPAVGAVPAARGRAAALSVDSDDDDDVCLPSRHARARQAQPARTPSPPPAGSPAAFAPLRELVVADAWAVPSDLAAYPAGDLDAAAAAVAAALATAEQAWTAAAAAVTAVAAKENEEGAIATRLADADRLRGEIVRARAAATAAQRDADAAAAAATAAQAAAATARGHSNTVRAEHAAASATSGDARVSAEADVRALRSMSDALGGAALRTARAAATAAAAALQVAQDHRTAATLKEFISASTQLAVVTARMADAEGELRRRHPTVAVTIAPGETLSEAVARAARAAAEAELRCRAAREKIDGQIDVLRGMLAEHDSQLVRTRGTRARATAAAIKLAAGDALCADIAVLEKHVATAVAAYHATKLDHVNAILRELWAATYRGPDIVSVELAAERGGADGEGEYTYRVAMTLRDAPPSHKLDMRARCSAGQRMLVCLLVRVALAEAFGGPLGMVALDEPTTNMDATNARALGRALALLLEQHAHRHQRLQLVVITHDENFVDSLARVTRLHEMFCVRKATVPGVRYPVSVVEHRAVPQSGV